MTRAPLVSETPRNTDYGPALAVVGTDGSALGSLGSLVPVAYDDVTLSYTDADLTTVVYKSGGTTVATITLSYTDGKLTNVHRA